MKSCDGAMLNSRSGSDHNFIGYFIRNDIIIVEFGRRRVMLPLNICPYVQKNEVTKCSEVSNGKVETVNTNITEHGTTSNARLQKSMQLLHYFHTRWMHNKSLQLRN